MKRKYYYIFAVIIVLVAVVIIPSFSKPIPPENDFPISEKAINTAIKNAELQIVLGEKNILDNEVNKSTAYFLMDKDDKMIGILQIVFSDTSRLIAVSPLYEETSLCNAFQKEDYPKVVQMMAELYGGFADNTVVYRDFSKNIPTDSTMWHKRYGKIIATIAFSPNEKNLDGITEHGVRIMNEASLDFQIAASEKAIKATTERLEKFPERNTKEAQEYLAADKKSLERLKKIK